jgi:DNA (cytosine-5)-methyltransferase 1
MSATEGRLGQVLKATSPVFSIGEMYCGPGGLALGAARASVFKNRKRFGFRHLFATDRDRDTCNTYELNLRPHSPELRVICEDVKRLAIDELPPVDGFMFGFPCNDFSSVGESKGIDGKFGPLYEYGVEYIESANPLFFVAENVSGLSSANSGKAFEIILKALANAGRFGYRLTTNLYRFEQYGVPQARHRIVIVGMREDLDLTFRVPRPSGTIVTCKQAIENPPISHSAKNHEFTTQSPRVVERLSHIGPGENAWSENMPRHLRLNVKGARLSQIYKRLDPSKPAYTVTGSGGGGTHVYHWRENRALTNRERARLQTFPDDFEFVGSKESVRRQIGMAVPPTGAEVILVGILKTLLGVTYRASDPSFSPMGPQIDC